MSRLEDFLNKDKENIINLDLLTKSDSKYQCVTCDLYSQDSYFDEREMIIYWYCENQHLSKVNLVGESGD
jgi:hypothetical protein